MQKDWKKGYVLPIIFIFLEGVVGGYHMKCLEKSVLYSLCNCTE